MVLEAAFSGTGLKIDLADDELDSAEGTMSILFDRGY